MFCIHPTYPLGYCRTSTERTPHERHPEIDIDVRGGRPSGTVVDVRERPEYAAGHVGGALLIPMGQLAPG